MKSMKYRIFEKGMINNGFKYEIGKRYKVNLNLQKNKFYFYNELFLDYNMDKYTKFCIIKIYEEPNSSNEITEFKIIKELDYSQFKNKYGKENNFISALKNRDTKSLEYCLKRIDNFDNYNLLEAIINSTNEKYLKILRKKNENYINKCLIKKLGRNKDLNRLLSSSYAHTLIANCNRPQNLDELIKSYSQSVVVSVLQQNRKKDRMQFLSSPFSMGPELCEKIALTGNEEYLNFLFNKTDHGKICAIQFLSKKKLDNIMENYYSYSEKILGYVASRGYEDHLDILVKHVDTLKDNFLLMEILRFKRQKDIDYFKENMNENIKFFFEMFDIKM